MAGLELGLGWREVGVVRKELPQGLEWVPHHHHHRQQEVLVDLGLVLQIVD